MKGKFFYLAVGALALSACTSEDVVDDAVLNNNAIGFENVVNKISRADLTTGSLEKFHVFGFYVTPDANNKAVELFHDVPVTLDKTNATWSYEGQIRYWVPDMKYYFYAYSCGNISKLNDSYGTFTMDMSDNIQPSARVLKINRYLCDHTHQHDLIYTQSKGTTEAEGWSGILGKDKGNEKVAFQFRHILSKVKAQFTSLFPEDYTVKVSDVKIVNIRNVGDYNPNDVNGWQNVSRKKDAQGNDELAFVALETKIDENNYVSTDAKTGTAPAKTGEAYVIPYTYNGQEEDGSSTYVNLTFHIQVENKGVIVFTKDIIGKFDPSWTAGCTYIYNINLDGEGSDLEKIEFTTTTLDENGSVISWGSPTEIEFGSTATPTPAPEPEP